MSFRGSNKAQQNKTTEALNNAKRALTLCLVENQRLADEVALLESRLSTATDKHLLLLEQLIKANEIIRELSAAGDDARGKPCPDCGEPTVGCGTMNLRVCNGCKTEWDWQLNEGQLPLVSSNRATRRTA